MNKLLVALLILLGLLFLFYDSGRWEPDNDDQDMSNGHSGDGSGYSPEVTFDNDTNAGFYQTPTGEIRFVLEGEDYGVMPGSYVLNGIQIELNSTLGTLNHAAEENAIYVDENWDCYFKVGKKCVIGKEDIK
jgi:hypothetical protein